MSGKKLGLKGMRILVVDDEKDILDTVVEALERSQVDTALDYGSAVKMIEGETYDLAILDIMGVHGLHLLRKTVSKGIPTVMLTAHAMAADALMKSIEGGAIAFLPKEKLSELQELLEAIIQAHRSGKATWKILFDVLGAYFDETFGSGWQERHKDFWSKFEQTYSIGKGIQTRLMHDRKVRSKGV